MKETARREFPVDNASILFLSLIRPYHTNNFRFSMTLKEPVCPDVLQQAVNRIHPRFPSIIAGLRQNFFHYTQVSAAVPPTVKPDPGLLHPMSQEELHRCAFRVFYEGGTISVEMFHALTDGSGAIVVLTTLVAEYLQILYGAETPASAIRLDTAIEPPEYELEDSYLDMAESSPRHLPSRFSYLPSRSDNADWQVRNSILKMDTKCLLDAARRNGVTLNTLLTSVLAASLMELQMEENGSRRLKPVRIMVPINLRKMIGSRTLRNFSLYALPTMEGFQHTLSLHALCKVIDAQLKEQLSQENQSAMVSYNVRTQNAWYIKFLPWKLKATALRLGYRFFGESNSSLTLTNLGRIVLPDKMLPYISDFHCWMTPRVTSPYGCTVLSFGDKLTLNMCRFCPDDQLGTRFFQKLQELVKN